MGGVTKRAKASDALGTRAEELRRLVKGVLDRAVATTGGSVERDELIDLDNADALLELTLELLAEQLAGGSAGEGKSAPAELCRRVIELHEAQRELHALRTDQRTTALANVQEGLSRLRGVTSVPTLLLKASPEICHSCGFDRAVLFRVDGSTLLAVSACVVEDSGASDALLESASAPVELTSELLEADVLRRRTPRIADAPGSKRARPGLLTALPGTQSYVVAPIAPQGQVIGIIAADCQQSGRRLDALDRDTLWAFAEGLGYAAERSVLLNRLRKYREEMARLVSSSQTALTELCEAQIELSETDAGAAASAAAGLLGSSQSPITSLLSTRELDVMELLATGATNAKIAERLVISENSVKSHVRRILRKLHAANRAEAVSRFMRLFQQSPNGRLR